MVIPAANIRNFTTDWNSGRVLSALVETCVPGSVPEWNVLDDRHSVDNITNAMQVVVTIDISPLFYCYIGFT